MTPLLRAGFHRLFKSKMFWLSTLLVVGCSIVFCASTIDYFSEIASEGIEQTPFAGLCFSQVPFLGLCNAFFTCLFLGGQYKGSLRNKIIMGHSRVNIYVSDFLVCLLANIVFLVAALLFQAPILIIYKGIQVSVGQYALCVLISAGVTVVLTAFNTLISIAFENKAFAVGLAVCLWFVMVLLSSGIYTRLEEPEIIQAAMEYKDGQFIPTDPYPNARYISGTLRVIMEKALGILPVGQLILVADDKALSYAPFTPPWMLLSDVLLSLLLVGAGALVFKRKDLV